MGIGEVLAGVALVAGVVALAAAVLLRRAFARSLDDLAARMLRQAAAERRATEAERDRLAMVVRELADAVLIAGADERIRLANPAAERLLGTTPLAGRRLIEVVRDHEVLEAIQRARHDTEAIAEVERFTPPRSVRVAARSLPGGELLLAMQDLAAMRRLDTVRRDFIANVSHELRTPLASLKAMAEALEGGALDHPADARDFVSRMHREIDDLTQLVTELLTLTRIESGATELRLEPVAPTDVIGAAVARFGPLADRGGIAVTAAVADDLPPVSADRDRIAQVLANLVHNAVKFTAPGGTITIGAEREDSAVRFFVRDTGEGIPREDLERVFERFFKRERSRATGGTGLGLAIAKHIVLAHNGRIGADSAGVGRGSTFWFRLPIR